MKVAETHRLDIARLLLEYGADVNAYTSVGKTALMAACSSGQGAIARLLLDECASTSEAKKGCGSALISAASFGHADCLRMLLEDGADDALELSYQSKTPLQWAQAGKSEGHQICQRLLEDAMAEVRRARSRTACCGPRVASAGW